MDICRKVTRAQPHDHRFRGQVRKSKVYRTSGGDVSEDLILPDPAHAAGPIALPTAAVPLGNADGSQVSLLRLRGLRQPEDPAAILRVPPELVGHSFDHHEISVAVVHQLVTH